MTASPVIVWFRQDLRLADNPALAAAVSRAAPILPVYVHDDESPGEWAPGGASRWWLHRSLESLDDDLGNSLRCFRGTADRILPELADAIGAKAVFANRCVEPWRIEQDAAIASGLRGQGVSLHLSASATLFDPAAVLKPDGTPYRVFTPFYRRGCLQAADAPREPLPAPARLDTLQSRHGGTVSSLALMPEVEWYREIERTWVAGEASAWSRLERFLERGLRGYREGRNRPDLEHVSRLSPHLHFGEISPNQVWYAVGPLHADPRLADDVASFQSELGWREFAAYLLWHWPDLPTRNFHGKFDRFPWMAEAGHLERWQRGLTGFPIVDAGMRELWSTGYMHNRVRMIAGSLLVKNLLADWRAGERWFWDTLVDADLANNSASWQWVAGSGADAAPYFRIFNPVTQGQKFDPNGNYVRRYVPELAAIDNRYLHRPWEAPGGIRRQIDYPDPIVDLKTSRERALDAFHSISS